MEKDAVKRIVSRICTMSLFESLDRPANFGFSCDPICYVKQLSVSSFTSIIIQIRIHLFFA